MPILNRKQSIKLDKAMIEAENNTISKQEYDRLIALFNKVMSNKK